MICTDRDADMMCCCRDVDEQDGQPQGRAASGIEEHPPARVVRLASFEDDLITPVEVDQLTNKRSKISLYIRGRPTRQTELFSRWHIWQ